MNNEQRLKAVIDSDADFWPVVEDIMNEYSAKIYQAIYPVYSATAPMIVTILRKYADEIERIDPDTKEIAEGLMGWSSRSADKPEEE